MKNATASKMSYFILMFIFLIIIASFLFSGFDNFSMGSARHVAMVDDTPVTTREYQQALQRQVQFFSQMMGDQGLSQKQLEEMGIKQSVLDGLIQQKLIMNTADELGVVVSMDEVKDEIKGLPYFRNQAGQFDVNQYRNALQMNGYTPTQFEEMIRAGLKQKKMDALFDTTTVSEEYARDVLRFKNAAITVHAIKIGRQALSPLVSVTDQEIKDYLAKPENKKALEVAYTDNASKYNKAAEVKVRHILFTSEDPKAEEKAKALRAKLTSKNFAQMADKETQDPTGKGKGGDLGWISAGRMVPEFEAEAFKMNKGDISQPVKTQFGYHLIYAEDKKAADVKPLESVQSELAQMAIQKTKPADLDNLLKTEEARLTEALKKDDIATVEATAKKVDADFQKGASVNRFDQTLENLTLSPQEAEQLFKAEPGSVVSFGNAGAIYLVKVVSKSDAQKVPADEDVKKEATALNQSFSRKLREDMLKGLNNKAKVVTNPALM